MTDALKRGYYRLLCFAGLAAGSTAVLTYGMACRYILYEPSVPAKLREAR